MKKFLQFAIPAMAVVAVMVAAAHAGSDKSCSSASNTSGATCTSKSEVKQASNTGTNCSQVHAQNASNVQGGPAASCTGAKQTAAAGNCSATMQTASNGSCTATMKTASNASCTSNMQATSGSSCCQSMQGASAAMNTNGAVMQQVGNPGSCTASGASASAAMCNGAAMKTASNDACCATKGASASMDHCAQGAGDATCLKDWSLPKGMAYSRLEVPGGVDFVFTGKGIDQLSNLCVKSCSDTATKTGNRFAMASGEGYVVLSVRGENSNSCCTQVLETALATSGAATRQS